MNSENEIKRIFGLMREFRQFPKYQLERRLDIFIALFLADFLRHRYGGVPVELVAPEMPLKKEEGNKLTTNADYLLHRSGPNPAWILLELKTDAGSMNFDQCGRYLEAQKKGMATLLQEIKTVRGKPSSNAKYDYLLNKFNDETLLRQPIEIVYLSPYGNQPREFGVLPGIETVAWVALDEFRAWTPVGHTDIWRELTGLLSCIPAAPASNASASAALSTRSCPRCPQPIKDNGTPAQSRRSLDTHIKGAHSDVALDERIRLVYSVFPD